MKKFWSFLTVLIFCGLFVLGFTYREDIVNYVMKSVIQNKEVTLPSEKSNFNNYEFTFVQETDDFHVKSKQEILNAIYTILNHGMTNFTFYCDTNYDSCLDDLNSISQDQVLLSTINNFVSPFNSYEKIYFKTDKNFRKTQQLFKNPQVAMCFNGVQVEGKAVNKGLVVDEPGRIFEKKYKEFLWQSYNAYSHVDTEILIEVTPEFVEIWDEDQNRKAFQIFIDFKDQSVEYKPYD